MHTALVTESLKRAFAHTKQVLLEPFDLGRWLKLGFIAMFGGAMWRGGGSSGGSVPNLPAGGGEEGGEPYEVTVEALSFLASALNYVIEHVGELIMVLVGLGLVWLVIVFVIVYIRCVFRFIFVDVVASEREPSIGSSWQQHYGQGLSLLGWVIVIALVPLALVLIALLPIVVSGPLIFSGEPLSAIVGAGGIVTIILAFGGAMVLLMIVHNLTDDFLVPAMYVDGGGVLAGWRKVFAAWRGQFWTIVIFYLLKLALAIGAGIAAGFAMIPLLVVALLPLGTGGAIVLGALRLGLSGQQIAIRLGVPLLMAGIGAVLVLSYMTHCLLLPITVFFRSYSLSFIGRLDARLRTIE